MPQPSAPGAGAADASVCVVVCVCGAVWPFHRLPSAKQLIHPVHGHLVATPAIAPTLHRQNTPREHADGRGMCAMMLPSCWCCQCARCAHHAKPPSVLAGHHAPPQGGGGGGSRLCRACGAAAARPAPQTPAPDTLRHWQPRARQNLCCQHFICGLVAAPGRAAERRDFPAAAPASSGAVTPGMCDGGAAGASATVQ